MTKVLIYGKSTGLLKRVVSLDAGTRASNFLGSGEAALVVTGERFSGFNGPTDAQKYVRAVAQILPVSTRAVMVDQFGSVVSVHDADPGSDRPFPGHRLIWTDTAQRGWAYVDRFLEFPPTRQKHFVPPRRLRKRA